MPTTEEWERWYGTPEPAVLHARAEGGDIVLCPVGTESQCADVMQKLGHLTAVVKFRKNKYDNAPHIPLTWAMVTQCANLAASHGFKWNPDDDLKAWVVDEFTRRFSEYAGPSDLKFDISSMDREPMPHQAAGAFMCAENKRVFLADAAGTGKTMTALLALAEMDARGMNPFPAFVVTPASVVDPWLEELEACFPHWVFTAYRGPRRKKLSSRYQVYVMSWDTFRSDMQISDTAECPNGHGRIEWKTRDQKELDKHLLGQVSTPQVCASCGDIMFPADNKDAEPPLLKFMVPKTFIGDESHALCNVKTRQSIAARKIAKKAENIILLSGTPITNNVGGFWSAHNVMDISSFTDQERYKSRYTDRYKNPSGAEEISGLSPVNKEEFFTVLQGSLRRVSKKDVLKDLPDKTYVTRMVDIPAAYRAAYNEMEEDMLAHLPDGGVLPVMSTLAQLQRLTQLACSACDVEVEYMLDEKEDSPTFGEEVPHYKVTMISPSWKVTELMQVLSESDGEPVVAFAPHTQLVNLAGAQAEKEGYKVGYIKGGQTSVQRSKVRAAFQGGELDLLCVNTAAGGVGLTLHRAHTAVFLERSFAYWREDQAEDRLHRKGQTAQVTVIDIVARNTIEQRAHQALVDKSKNLAELVQDPGSVRAFLGG